jgi:hypothetical protein
MCCAVLCRFVLCLYCVHCVFCVSVLMGVGECARTRSFVLCVIVYLRSLRSLRSLCSLCSLSLIDLCCDCRWVGGRVGVRVGLCVCVHYQST